MHNHTDLPTEGFVRLPTILSVYPVSKSTWWQMVKDGRAPKPVKLSPAITAWRVADIRALIRRLEGEEGGVDDSVTR